MADLILTQAPTSQLIEKARERGFKTLTEAAFDRLYESQTTIDEIRPYYLAHDGLDDEEQKVSTTPTEDKKENVEVKSTEDTLKDKGRIEKQTVVLIEDDEDVRKILALLLEKEMFEVIEAENGQEGLQAVYEHQPTLVLCDLMMPVMDGKEFLVKMKGNEQTNEIPIVILTAADTESNETGLLDLGAADFVSKSSSSAVMLSRLRRVLQSS